MNLQLNDRCVSAHNYFSAPGTQSMLALILLMTIGVHNGFASSPVSCDLRKTLSVNVQAMPNLTWQELKTACQAEINAYTAHNPVGYTWYANAANGFSGTPLVVLKALPSLAPEIWGPPQDNFAKFGLFPDPDRPDRVLPRGLGIASANGRPVDEHMTPTGEIDYAKPGLYITTFSCGACHSGRVQLGNSYEILEGAPNTQFDVRAWRQAFIDTRKEYFAPEQIGTDEAPGETTRKILAFIDAQESGYFAKGLPLLAKHDEQAIDAQQRAIVKANIVPILTGIAYNVRASDWMIKLQTSRGANYGDPNHSPKLAGNSAGQSDGSGDLLAQLVAMAANAEPGLTEEAFLARSHPAIPPFATVTDIPSVWNQRERSAAQWDGSVSMGFWRNIAAQLPIVGDPNKVDLDNTHIVDKFLIGLPAAPYPFDVDLIKAAKGEALYANNCADCHKANSEKPYWEMYTDFNRASVLNEKELTEAYRIRGSFADYRYHTWSCFEFFETSGKMHYIRFRLIPGDRGPERGLPARDFNCEGQLTKPPVEGDPRAEDFLRQDFVYRVNHSEISYILQAQLHEPENPAVENSEVLNPASAWDENFYPWLDLCEIKVETIISDNREISRLTMDPNRSPQCIKIPLATSPDHYASLGQARAIVYPAARDKRKQSEHPQNN